MKVRKGRLSGNSVELVCVGDLRATTSSTYPYYFLLFRLDRARYNCVLLCVESPRGESIPLTVTFFGAMSGRLQYSLARLEMERLKYKA